MKVRFLKDVSYSGGGIPEDAREFKAGQIADLPEASARHWTHRHLAETYIDDPVQSGPGSAMASATVSPKAESEDEAVLPPARGYARRRNKMVDADDVTTK